MSDQEDNTQTDFGAMSKSSGSFLVHDEIVDDETETESTANTADYVASRPKILQTFKREFESPGSRANDEQHSASGSTKHKKTDAGASAKKRGAQNEKNKKTGGVGAKAGTNEKTTTTTETSHIQTQTDWSWIQDMQIMEKIRREGADFLHDLLEEVKSESGESDDESDDTNARTNLDHTPRIDAVGPPKILQYLPEANKKPELTQMSESPSLSIDSDAIEDFSDFMKELNVYINGGNPCEFCGKSTKKWPSIQTQEHSNPELLYCCNDYREFVEALIEYQNERDRIRNQEVVGKTKPAATTKNKRAQQLAKERAELRNIQRMLQKQKRMEQMAKEKQHQMLSSTSRTTDGARDPIANQLRSINYQLSNLKYMQEGWTVRPKSPIDFDQINFNDIEYNLMAQAVVSDGEPKTDDKSLIVRYYANGNTFLVLFPDGSGNVFYPSGHVAISISTISSGMHILSIFSDEDDSKAIQMASFDPYGNGFCNFNNGKIRIMLNPLGGMELDSDGSRKKRWFWSDLSEHVHAPPLQPIIFAINHNISVKIVNKDKICVNFIAETHMCRFMVGSKVKILNTETLPASIKYDSNETYLKKKRNRINDILRVLNEENNVLRLPKIASTPRDFNTSMKTKPNLVTDVLKLNKSRETYHAKKPNPKTNRFLTVP